MNSQGKRPEKTKEEQARKQKQRRPTGFWFNTDRTRSADSAPSEEAMENLEALGYVDGTVVWEFLNPHGAGSNHEFVAVIPEMIRLPPEIQLEWLP